MKIVFILDTQAPWFSGIWYHRTNTPSNALDKRGHGLRWVMCGAKNDDVLEWADVAIFGRTYAPELKPVELMQEFKKRGKRILYDIDDDFWEISKDNPSSKVGNANKDQIEDMIRLADGVLSPSKILLNKIAKYFPDKAIYSAPNGIDYEEYKPRPKQRQELVIGYMGAASHWKDLQIIMEPLQELHKKHKFSFDIYGMTAAPMEADMYTYEKFLQNNLKPEMNEFFKEALKFYDGMKGLKGRVTPFMPPELHPGVLSACDFDIALAPLEDTEFNHGKSCIKFYENAAVGAVVLASDVEPYKSEVNYRAKNITEDWVYKLERLITDTAFREKTLKEQQEYVQKNRSLDAIGIIWEKACQKPGGIPMANQENDIA